jgi:2-polyprenyl-3-methyl-5-hydroxy-6-metoxy-1,4-benzoquinol methylase
MIGRGQMRNVYKYPDVNDTITCALINNHEPYKGYWAESEKKIIDLMKRLIEVFISTKCSSLLDAGCGDGRLINYFLAYFNHILAIDPDETRLHTAKSLAKQDIFSQKVTFKTISIEGLDEIEKFDVILCSHILQHVNTNNISTILNKFSNILKKDGLLLITTTHSIVGMEYFVKEFLKDSEFIEEQITEEEFNSLVSEVGQLAIHFFIREKIEEALKHYGFEIINFKVFHVMKNDLSIYRGSDIDREVNLDPNLQSKIGRDMFIAAKRL